MPARVLANGPLSVSVSFCLSQVGVLSKCLDGSSWFLACRLLWIDPTLCFKQIRVCSKMSPSGTLLQTLDVARFATAYCYYYAAFNAPCFGHKDGESHAQDVESCYQLSSRKVDARSVINWAIVVQLIILPSSEARPLLFIAQIVKLCLQHDFVARVN